MITIELGNDDFDECDNVIIGNVVAAITRVISLKRQRDFESAAKERDIAEAISKRKSKKRKQEIALTLTGRVLLTKKEAANAKPGRSYTLRYPNRFTVERDAWAFFSTGVAQGRISPIDPIDQNLPCDYGTGSVPLPQLVAYGQVTGLYNFTRAEVAPANKNADAEAAGTASNTTIVQAEQQASESGTSNQDANDDAPIDAKEPTAPVKRINNAQAFLLRCIDKEIPANIASIWLHIREHAGEEKFWFKSASASTATTVDDDKVEKKNLARALTNLLRRKKNE